MNIWQIAHWLGYALIGWTLVSIVAAPLIGRFLRGHLQHQPRTTVHAATSEQTIFNAHNVTVLPVAALRHKA